MLSFVLLWSKCAEQVSDITHIYAAFVAPRVRLRVCPVPGEQAVIFAWLLRVLDCNSEAFYSNPTKQQNFCLHYRFVLQQ